MRKLLPALALLVGMTGAAEAGSIEPMHAYSVELGSVRGSAYYTIGSDGLHLVAHFAEGESGKPIRISSVLAPNQRMRISVPAGVHEPASEIEFVREGNQIVVWRPVLAMN